MFVAHSRVYSKILLTADLLVSFVALLSAYSLRYLVRFVPLEFSRHFNPELLPFREYLFYFLLFLPVWVALLVVTQRYPELFRAAFSTQTARVLHFTILCGFLYGFLSYTFQLEISRPILFGFLAQNFLLLVANRLILDWVLRSRNVNEHNQVHLLMVGTGPAAAGLAQRMAAFEHWGFHVIGHLRTNGENGHDIDSELRVVGSLKDLPRLLKEDLVVHEIIFASSERTDWSEFEETIRLCEDLGIRIRMAADLLPSNESRVSIDYLEEIPLITLSTAPDHSVALVAKRVVDFGVACGCLVLLAPLMAAAAFMIKLSTPGPVFYRQERCGQYGRKFTLVKFRTMVDGAEDKLWEIKHLNEMSGPVFKMRNDPRVTWIGSFLRKSSIDELPQFWNVLKGEMSVVGPRAPLPEEVLHYSIKQRRRLSVKPGITCLWQVSGRNEIDFQQWMDLDLHYIDNWSLWLDVQIMLRTIPAVFSGRGAR